ncbi:MAG: DUF1648 domain-containing protein [Firmicutes bacterium]|nr:DUF1648 domain-containing protein [Bacillota bacterium]
MPTKDPGTDKKSLREKLFGQPRPVIDLPRTSLDNMLEALALLGLITPVYYLIKVWPHLPERFPIHFGINGVPDAWGGRGSLLPLLFISLFPYVLLTVLSFFPQTYNYPVEITPDNAERQYRLARGLILWLKFELAWLFGYIQWFTIQVAMGNASGLGIWLTPVVLATVFGTLGVYLWKSFRQRRT